MDKKELKRRIEEAWYFILENPTSLQKGWVLGKRFRKKEKR